MNLNLNPPRILWLVFWVFIALWILLTIHAMWRCSPHAGIWLPHTGTLCFGAKR
jgi:hypothetical protein